MITSVDVVMEKRLARKSKFIEFAVIVSDEMLSLHASAGLCVETVIRHELQSFGDLSYGDTPENLGHLTIWRGTQIAAVLRVLSDGRREVTTFDHGPLTQVYPALPATD